MLDDAPDASPAAAGKALKQQQGNNWAASGPAPGGSESSMSDEGESEGMARVQQPNGGLAASASWAGASIFGRGSGGGDSSKGPGTRQTDDDGSGSEEGSSADPNSSA